MREGARNFLVGAASMTALAGLGGLLMRFGDLDPLFHPRYSITIHTTNASGLRVGSAVDYNGVPVGTITEVTGQADRDFPVRIVAMINQDVPIPDDCQPSALTSLLGGSARLELDRPELANPNVVSYFPQDNQATIRSGLHGGLLEMISSQLDKKMGPLMTALDSFNQLSETYIELGKNLNDLVSPPGAEGGNADPNDPSLRSAIVKLNRAMDDIQASVALAREWLGDETMRADAKAAVTKASALIEKATDAVERYAKLADSLQTNADELVKRIAPVADEMGSTLEDIRRLVRLGTDGEGTIAQMLKNPDLYNSLNDAAVRLERALVDLQLLIQKLKAEGVRIGL